jgi:hypothetical protein
MDQKLFLIQIITMLIMIDEEFDSSQFGMFLTMLFIVHVFAITILFSIGIYGIYCFSKYLSKRYKKESVN